MGLTLKPIVACNMRCPGCYEGSIPMLWSGEKVPYDMAKIKAGIQAFIDGWRYPGYAPEVTFHGGEATLMRHEDLEELIKFCRERGAHVAIQTNGTLITARLIEVFKKYQVGIGVSIDGPWPIGRSRLLVPEGKTPEESAKALQINKRNVEKIMENIELMRKHGLNVSVICVLTKANAGTRDRLAQLKNWILHLKTIGICDGRLNPLYDDDPVIKEDLELTAEQYNYAFNDLADFILSDPELKWNSFREMVDNLLGLGIQPCWFSACDVYNTAAVQALFGDGSPGNCLRTSQDGVAYMRDTTQMSSVRQEILAQTPQELGGCKDCPWWRVCHGGCPAEAINGDWRNRSRFCPAENYAHLSKKLHALLPNVKTVEEWTTNDEQWLEQCRAERRSDLNAFMTMDPNWSKNGSSYQKAAEQRRETYGEQRTN
jgi:uncharacterized protein